MLNAPCESGHSRRWTTVAVAGLHQPVFAPPYSPGPARLQRHRFSTVGDDYPTTTTRYTNHERVTRGSERCRLQSAVDDTEVDIDLFTVGSLRSASPLHFLRGWWGSAASLRRRHLAVDGGPLYLRSSDTDEVTPPGPETALRRQHPRRLLGSTYTARCQSSLPRGTSMATPPVGGSPALFCPHAVDQHRRLRSALVEHCPATSSRVCREDHERPSPQR